MIKDLYIHNFQSHDSTEMEFDPGLNVIVGPSDSGKSAIIRALRWLIWNRPMGDAFIRHGTKGSFVNVTTEEMNVVHREKGKENLYRIDKEFYKAFGNDIPEEVQQALNMDETNLQQQLDRPFLISATPGEAAAYFNRIARLDKIDQGIRQVQGRIKELSNFISSGEAQLELLKQELQEYEYLEQFEVDLEELESMVSTKNQLVLAVQKIENAVELLEGIDRKEKELEAKCKLLSPVDHILKMIDEKNQLQGKLLGVSGLVQKFLNLGSEIDNLDMEIREMEEHLDLHMPEICPLCGNKVKK